MIKADQTYAQEELHTEFLHFSEAYALDPITAPADATCACRVCVDNNSHADCCVEPPEAKWPSL